MKINWISSIIALVLSALLAWWLWLLGIEDIQKWLLACVGGFIMAVGFVFGMGISYPNPRSGVQVRIVMNALGLIAFVASCIYSFFTFSPEGYCIPLGVFLILMLGFANKIYKSGE